MNIPDLHDACLAAKFDYSSLYAVHNIVPLVVELVMKNPEEVSEVLRDYFEDYQRELARGICRINEENDPLTAAGFSIAVVQKLQTQLRSTVLAHCESDAGYYLDEVTAYHNSYLEDLATDAQIQEMREARYNNYA